jgi:predicted enzyme related to lactoylglutathione lyase
LLPCARAADQPGSVDLPALATPATGEKQPGRLVWVDLVVPDLQSEESFYAALFGWSFRSLSAGQKPSALAMADGQPVASLIQRPLPRAGQGGPAWLGFFSTADLDATLRAATLHGAKQRSPVRSYPHRGPGQWIWSALFSSDPDDEAAFYQNVFGYQVYDLAGQSDQARVATDPNAQPSAQQSLTDSSAAAVSASDGAVEHLELASADYARASVNGMSADQARRGARWLHFVRVEDAAAAAAKAQSLGARILVPPRADRQGGRLAVIADPAGAPLGLMQWSDPDNGATP